MATAQTPVKTMLIAMIPGSSRLLYASGIYPLRTITRPKMKTNIRGCRKVCRSNTKKLRRATWASRASMAKKHFQFIPASSFPCGVETDSRGWAPKYAHLVDPRSRLRPEWQSRGSANRHGRRRDLRRCDRSRAPPGHPPEIEVAPASEESAGRIAAATEILRALNSSIRQVCLGQWCVRDQ